VIEENYTRVVVVVVVMAAERDRRVCEVMFLCSVAAE
jgi:hypothetical protein